MSDWTSRSRVEAVLAHETPDRPPVAAWGHFFESETDPLQLAADTVEFTLTYGWDWVKLNPRNTYYLEAFGNEYDYEDYHGSQPRQTRGLINNVADLHNVDSRRAIGSRPFTDQLTALSKIEESLPELPIAQTVFSPLTILLGLAGLARSEGRTIPGSTSKVTLSDLITQDPEGTQRALNEITITLEDYIASIAHTGAYAVYYALTGTANPAVTPPEVFAQFSAPYDRRIIDAVVANGLKILLHTCGREAFPSTIADYPVDAVSWDHFASGNPPLGAEVGTVPIVGVNRADVSARRIDAVKREAQTAIATYAERPFLLAPTCSTTTDLDNPALVALRESVDE